MERLRREVMEKFFFPAPVRNPDGTISPAPADVLKKYEELKKNWMMPHPKLSHEEPSVGFHPLITPQEQGYVVYTEIIYH